MGETTEVVTLKSWQGPDLIPSEDLADTQVPPANKAGDAMTTDSWPYSSRYFLPELMDGGRALTLLETDSEFAYDQARVSFIDITASGSKTQTTSAQANDFARTVEMTDLKQGATRVFFIPQKRHYPPDSTVSNYKLTKASWMSFLAYSQMPSDAIEFLHENNGGFASHVSHCQGTRCGAGSNSELCAYHVWIKMQPYLNDEHFVYAREDLHTGKKLIVVVGTRLQEQIHRLATQFGQVGRPAFFSTVLALVTTWAQGVEKLRWSLDFVTQRIEAKTGYTNLISPVGKPVPPERLELRKGMPTTRLSLTHTQRASLHLMKIFTFISEQAEKLHELLEEAACKKLPAQLTRQLQSACMQRRSQQERQADEAENLIARINTQWDVTNALISQHNNALNMQIASDARTDNIFIRRISFVTFAFLPATFLATFFSMTFFHVNDGKLTASPQIWIYVACVVPITAFMAWEFGVQDFLKRKFGELRRRPRPMRAVPKPDSTIKASERRKFTLRSEKPDAGWESGV